MAGEMVGIQEACALLQVSQVELQTFVERGELSATIGSAGELSFRREDVMNLKRARESEPTILVPTSHGGGPLPPPAPLSQINLPDEFAVSSEADATALPTALSPTGAPTGYDRGVPYPGGLPPLAPLPPPLAPIPQFAPPPSGPRQPAPVVPVGLPPGGGPGQTPSLYAPGGPSAAGPEQESGTEEIIIDDSDLVLIPLGEDEAAAQTSEVTVISTDSLGAPTVPGSPRADQVIFGPETGAEATQVEVVEGLRPGAETEAISSSYTQGGVRRVEAAIAAERAEELRRRTAPVYDLHPGAPISTVWLILTTMVLVFLGSVFGVIFWKGGHKENIRTPYVPRFLKPFYVWLKDREYVLPRQPVQTPPPSESSLGAGGPATGAPPPPPTGAPAPPP